MMCGSAAAFICGHRAHGHCGHAKLHGLLWCEMHESYHIGTLQACSFNLFYMHAAGEV